MVNEATLLQPSKALEDMLVTLLGMDMDVRLVHPSKARSPIEDTSSGIVILVKLLQL